MLLRRLLVMQMLTMLGAVGNGQLHARLDKVLLIVLLQIQLTALGVVKGRLQ